ncbi:DUF2505 domain-containing protein [Antrihabitans sp. YC3-6]|uniref:DUF2505 domain-containing protein n=1 Tax=Antrihabitans stalagmiti TaxID=2799499 RepID=A0A934NR15_9NOCA|nr:DUF2505 domain-containing protein [Antrihabitans stalagmiti]MBJ8339758.1 DUF2505 domain-containing protein [Antrihabitans stalagmiti]
MGHRIEHSARHTKSVDALHAAFTTEQYWKDRLAEIGGPGAELVEARTDSDTFSVTLIQGIAAKHLPPMVTRIRPGDLRIDRTESWGPLRNGSATGTFSVRTEGAPGKIYGTLTLTTDGTGSLLRIEGTVTVDIPFFGGKIEEAIAEQLRRLNEKEDAFTENWTSEQT